MLKIITVITLCLILVSCSSQPKLITQNIVKDYVEQEITLNTKYSKVDIGENCGISYEEYKLQLPFRIEPNSLDIFCKLDKNLQEQIEDCYIKMNKQSFNRLVWNVISYTLYTDGSIGVHSFVSNGFDKDILSYGYVFKLYKESENNIVTEVKLTLDLERKQILHKYDTEYVYINIPKEFVINGTESVKGCSYTVGYGEDDILFAE